MNRSLKQTSRGRVIEGKKQLGQVLEVRKLHREAMWQEGLARELWSCWRSPTVF